MGWLFPYGASKKDVVRELTQDWESKEKGVKCRSLRKCLKGNVLWQVRETVFPDGRVQRFISCDLLSKSGGDSWGYKQMDESCGPYYFTCPLPYLDMAPVANENWREGVRNWHAKAAGKGVIKSLKEGDVVVLKIGCTPRTLILASKIPLRGRAGWMKFRFQAKQVDAEETARAKEWSAGH